MQTKTKHHVANDMCNMMHFVRCNVRESADFLGHFLRSVLVVNTLQIDS